MMLILLLILHAWQRRSAADHGGVKFEVLIVLQAAEHSVSTLTIKEMKKPEVNTEETGRKHFNSYFTRRAGRATVVDRVIFVTRLPRTTYFI